MLQVIDTAGNPSKKLDYDSFGNIIKDSNSSITIAFGFTSGLCDPDTKLVGFGYRDCMPEIGRWTAKDPIGFAGSDPNLYRYVQRDPVNLVDPGVLPVIKGGIGSTITNHTAKWFRNLKKLRPTTMFPKNPPG